MRFIDEAEISVSSGKGGRGCVSFRREKYIPKGGPDGGDGGDGGSVFFRASNRLYTLYDFRHKRIHEARNGGHGMGSDRYGRKGDDLIVEVPTGTLLYELVEGETPVLLADLSEDGQEVLIARGGRGGKGNMHFKSSTMRAPRFAQPGEPGEEKRIRLELKVIADVGLLGLPNAGKSTFLSAVSSARPKIAPYPFTTLSPNLGVVHDDLGLRLIIADIPGLIEGASEGAGLGHKFLKHVERCKFLIHILSAEEINPDDPFAGFALLNEELARFDEALEDKHQIEVMNKIDLLSPDSLENLRQACHEAGRKVFFISALNGDGVQELLDEVLARFRGE